ncbi:hypothetical protein BC940DRAFT_315274 [Gongronella butleri]|nr:hypothetical protein BC940DRAFT_315274 [Gongronella butleri]
MVLKTTLLSVLGVAAVVSGYPLTKTTVLNCRSGPSTSDKIIKTYHAGDSVSVSCTSSGTVIHGSPIWDKTQDGCFVSDYYIKTGSSKAVAGPCSGGSTGGGGGGGGSSGGQGTKTGAAIVAAAQSMKGWPYSWAGGDINGPTFGTISPSGHDDRHVKGFDCSGLAKYAVHKATGITLGHNSCTQYNDPRGKKIPFAQKQPGDLIVYGSSGPGCDEHVAIYAGNNMMVEAQTHGVPVGTHPLRTHFAAPNVVRFT